MDKVYLDSDVILDLLTRSEPFYRTAALLFSMIERGEFQAYASPLIFANLFYILRKSTSRPKAVETLKMLAQLVKVAAMNEKIIDLALASGFPDFEDAVQYYTALENRIGCLITRNKKDYKGSQITICTPEEFVAAKNSL